MNGIPLSKAVVVLALALMLPLASPAGADAQARPQAEERRVSDPPVLRRSLRNVLGGVPMTAADSMHQAIVRRLDFDSYKELLYGLTRFGDREQGTPRNEAAIDWIEDQLRGWGYETERVQYSYTPRNSDTPEPREQVFATKIGATNPDEMYIVSAHMDGRGGGEAANDDGSGTALVMEIARILAASDIGNRNDDLTVESPGAQQGRIENIGTVGGGNDDNAFI